MSPFALLQGSACALPLADQSIDVVCTSPPYLGLRVYQGLPATAWPGGRFVPQPGAAPVVMPAWQGCFGNEETVDLYLYHAMLWLQECWRVLVPTGVVWINLGDSYANDPGNGRGGERVDGGRPHRSRLPKQSVPPGNLLLVPHRFALAAQAAGWIVRQDAVWAKTCPMPESVSGWKHTSQRCPCTTARSATPRQGWAQQNAHARHDHRMDIRHKLDGYGQPNPACPTCHGTGHTADVVLRQGSWRHTRAQETVLMLTKQMRYFCDSTAVREDARYGRSRQGNALWSRARNADPRDARTTPPVTNSGGDTTSGRNPRSILAPPPTAADHLAALHGWLATEAPAVLAAYEAAQANPSSVLRPAPAAFAGPHYATFPASLVEPLLRAACPARCCIRCGAPWAPWVTAPGMPDPSANGSRFDRGKTAHHGHIQPGLRTLKQGGALLPTCTCYCRCGDSCTGCGQLPPTAWRAGRVLDLFCGSGTTLAVARELGRTGIGIELSPTYVQLARERLALAALDAWTQGAPARQETFDDLPLFQR